MLIVLATSPRVAPGLLSLAAWQALRSAAVVLAPAGHPQLPALDEAGIAYRIVDAPGQEAVGQDGTAVWLAPPGGDPVIPAGAQVLRGSADLPGAHLIDLVATMDRLRRECPWDARQTHESLLSYLLEESYEALDALESGDQEALREELGDVLLQVAFHARIAAERDDGYDIDDIADGIVAKLVRRHPHVFADVSVSGADEVTRNWDDIKREEKRERAERAGVAGASADPPSALDGVPFGQPALSLAAQLQRRAERAGVPDELARLDDDPGKGPGDGSSGDGDSGDVGRDLFRLVARVRAEGRDPEMELRAAARRYRDLVRNWERPLPAKVFSFASSLVLNGIALSHLSCRNGHVQSSHDVRSGARAPKMIFTRKNLWIGAERGPSRSRRPADRTASSAAPAQSPTSRRPSYICR